MQKIAVVVTDLVEDVEFVDPVQALRDVGHDVTVIGFAQTPVTGKHGTTIKIDRAIADVTPEDFDALLHPRRFLARPTAR
jgi:Putative intracellular protease/amidase